MPVKLGRRLPWAITLATLLLWAMSPGGWGRSVLEGAAFTHLSGLIGRQISAATYSDPIEEDGAAGDGIHKGSAQQGSSHLESIHNGVYRPGGVSSLPECEPSQAVPPTPSAPSPVPPFPQGATPDAATSGPTQATFRLCGTGDSQAARSIEQLVAGRPFSATLVGLRDGCAELTITVTGAMPGSPSSGRQSTNLTVGAGRGGGQGVAVRIVSENGTTQASITPAS